MMHTDKYLKLLHIFKQWMKIFVNSAMHTLMMRTTMTNRHGLDVTKRDVIGGTIIGVQDSLRCQHHPRDLFVVTVKERNSYLLKHF